MKKKDHLRITLSLTVLLAGLSLGGSGVISSQTGNVQILLNQVAYPSEGPKEAIVKNMVPLPLATTFKILEQPSGKPVFEGSLTKSQEVNEWEPGTWYNRADFSSFNRSGNYILQVSIDGKLYRSERLVIGEKALSKIAIPAIVHFFHHQRASSPEEQEADRHVLLYGSDRRVDLHGGWCDASGDVSKYFSHLAYTNFMLPQQIPMVTWSLINTFERVPQLLQETGIRDSLMDEALYGADYIIRSLDPAGYFYMTVFSYFKKDPNERRVVGLLADSKTTSDYPCAYREGGGMAIAALARISRWKKGRDFSPAQYLAAAERAFAHLQKYSTRYADDGKENIIDDYTALMASAELWLVTGKATYRTAARKRAANLASRLSPAGYFIANDTDRPFWHAADAGLPIIALVRYLDAEHDEELRAKTILTIRKALDYNIQITQEVNNPFGYARQSFLYRGELKNGFFIPHENESGWWWQGENARLSSLAAAALAGGRLAYPGQGAWGVQARLARYTSDQVSWIMGCNPYNMCMMFGFGNHNVPYMSSMYGHGSGRGGISNGITGKDGDGSGIDFKTEDNGNEWRWSEQWIPHSAWFLQAVTMMAMR